MVFSPRLLATVALLVAMALAAWTGAGLFYRLVLPAPPVPVAVAPPAAEDAGRRQAPEQRRDLSVIVRRDIFASRRPSPPAAKKAPPPRLDLALIGTILAPQAKDSRAIIEETRKKVQGLYGIGDTVGRARLLEIHQGMVVLEVDGRRVELTAGSHLRVAEAPPPPPEPEPAPPAEPPAAARTAGRAVVSVSRHRLELARQVAPQILKSITVTPFEVDGQPAGLMVSGVKTGSFLNQMGLRSRDVVTAVNGEPVTSLEDAARIYQKYRDADGGTVTLLRGGREMELRYQVR